MRYTMIWEWPKGYGPHDTIVLAGSYGVATARQKWGYGGYGQVLRRHGGVANRADRS